MKVYFGNITGVEEAINSMMMSKRTWTPEISQDIHDLMIKCTGIRGEILEEALKYYDDDVVGRFKCYLNKLIKYGVKLGHTTLLRFIDISFIVQGLHRGAQDDFDSHAKRLDNRIIRSSTRLAKYNEAEKSDWYKDKILTTDEALKILNIPIPDSLMTADGEVYVKSPGGYVRSDLKGINDVCRGLYPLSIPSNFIFKVQYPELCHIVQLRDKESHAHPELQDMMEQIRSILLDKFYVLGANLNNLKMEPNKSE